MNAGRIRLALLPFVVLLFFLFSGSFQAHCKDLPPEVDSFRKDVEGELIKRVDKKIDELKKKLKSKKSSDIAARSDIKDQIKALKTFKKRMKDKDTVESLYNNLKTAKDSINKLSKEWEQNGGYLGPTTFLPSEVNLSKLETYRSGSVKLYDYYKKIMDLKGSIEKMDTMGYSPETKRLYGGLRGLGMVMSEFGDKVPLIGAFIKGYGDITTGLVDAVAGLKKKIQSDIKEGMVGVGSPCIGDVRNQAWIQQGFQDTVYRVQGLRDVYTPIESGANIYMWDPKAKRKHKGKVKIGMWLHVPTVAPGVGMNEIRRRYRLYFEKAGKKNPSATQILKEFRKAVEISLTAPIKGVEAGGKFRMVPQAELIHNRKPLSKVWVMISEKGGRVDAIESQVGRVVKWPAPEDQGKYILNAELAEASEGWTQLGKCKLEYYVGRPTITKMAVRPAVLTTTNSEPVKIKLALTCNGEAVSHGFLSVDEPTQEGTLSESYFAGEKLEQKFWDLEWKPYAGLKKGKIVIAARYSGHSVESEDIFICPSSDSKTIRVYEPIRTRLVVSKSPAAEGVWTLKPHLSDSSGNIVKKGELALTATAGRIKAGDKTVDKVKLPLSQPITWASPSDRGAVADITVKYSGCKTKDMNFYAPAQTSFKLPETLNLNTKTILSAKKMKADDSWGVIAEVDTENNAVEVRGGDLTLQCSAGVFANGLSTYEAAYAGGAVVVLWKKPEKLGQAAIISASYKAPEQSVSVKDGGNFVEVIFGDSIAKALSLPPGFLRPVQVRAAVESADPESGRRRIEFSVKTIDEAPVKVGRVNIKANKGLINERGSSLAVDLSDKGKRALFWTPLKQADDAASEAVVIFNYQGDQSGNNGRNAVFSPAEYKLQLSTRPDTEAPVIKVSGVSDGGEYQEGKRVTISVQDNSEEPLAINAICAYADGTSGKIPFVRRSSAQSSYSAVLDFRRVCSPTLDIRVTDVSSNAASAIVSFKITSVDQEDVNDGGKQKKPSEEAPVNYKEFLEWLVKQLPLPGDLDRREVYYLYDYPQLPPSASAHLMNFYKENPEGHPSRKGWRTASFGANNKNGFHNVGLGVIAYANEEDAAAAYKWFIDSGRRKKGIEAYNKAAAEKEIRHRKIVQKNAHEEVVRGPQAGGAYPENSKSTSIIISDSWFKCTDSIGANSYETVYIEEALQKKHTSETRRLKEGWRRYKAISSQSVAGKVQCSERRLFVTPIKHCVVILSVHAGRNRKQENGKNGSVQTLLDYPFPKALYDKLAGRLLELGR